MTVSLSNAKSTNITVNYASSNGTAISGTDYTAVSNTLTFTAGQTSKTFTITTIQDTTYEGNETITITLSTPSGATISDGTAIATINDNDNEPTISIDDISITE